ncbi:YdbL family protein [Halopseudomonas salegens]|uniref:DUF1318 domain-containing protein n=1 Tax=Halopseudomonas salegens TaxID=1434072 RepID=A0A1H2HHS7_9GAMM|nr:YdbL family protein [Halopseudomonas salegens]SDU31108.1 hypothetical protein SAMN05216210_3035 [Halopseudomonas salegens]
MHPITRFSALCLIILFSLPALAMNLNQAMTALPAAKEAGHLGEQPDGYLGVVKPVGEADEIASLINAARRAEYQRLADEHNVDLSDIQARAGKKAIERTPAGQYIQLNGVWMTK